MQAKLTSPAVKVFHTVRLSPQDVSVLLDNLQSGAATFTGQEVRRFSRLRMADDQPVVLMIHCAMNGPIRYRVVPRNISAGGMALLHGQFIHRHTECFLMLPKRTGEWLRLAAKVTNCRHVRGSLHEVSVQFAEEIEPEAFVHPRAVSAR